MSRKKKQKPQTPPAAAPSGTPLTGARLALAHELAKHGIAALFPDHEIVLSIVEKCATTERSARAALQRVASQGTKLSDADRDTLRDTLHFRLEHLYAREAQAGRSEAAAKMLDRRARLAGLYGKEVEAPKEAEVDEFDGRTLEEVRYFREHGFFPEDKPADNVIPLDPLARLKANQ